MGMKGFIFIVLNLAFSSGFYISTDEPNVEVITDNLTQPAKGALYDDILKVPFQRSAIVNLDQRWTFPVPYVFDGSLDLNAKGVLLRAFDQFRLKSCIDFKPRDSEQYYLDIQKLNGCYSYIGKVIPNGQTLSIGSGCDFVYIAEHELLHALGFYHEQSRYDRDDYVTILFENILEGKEYNFAKVGSDTSTTQGVPYDYWSVMHYSKNAFTNGNGSTIITRDPKFQDVIGQNLEMSASDVQELNLLYNCNSTITFNMHCSFSNGSICQMDRCSQSDNGWEMVTQAPGGPASDHSTVPAGGRNYGQETGYFMHASTISGLEGDSARLETRRMSPKRDCHVQCLQFYYYHSGDESDTLNIWIREFQDEWDHTGTLHLMGQITGSQTSHWTLQHVPLNATKDFQVVLESRKGAGNSTGGFSVDDINLSETECPHVTLQIDELEKLLNTSASARVYSPRQYSQDGYAYRAAVLLTRNYFQVFFQVVSGDNDDQLQWPCLQRQLTAQMLDQNPDLQLQMSKQRSFTTKITHVYSSDKNVWDNPRKTGMFVVDGNNQTTYYGPLYGNGFFASMDEMKAREFLKGGSVVFTFNFQDLTPLVNESTLPCAQVTSVKVAHPPTDQAERPCSSRDDSIFASSPGMVPSAVLTILLTLMLLMP